MVTPLIGVSESIIKINKLIKDLGNKCLNVLITGETGVGKEVVAQNLHAESAREKSNFVKINCAALPDSLLESELFGYKKGAFTGAEKNRPGKFQTADKGVLFLDEIGDMPMQLQSKILHVLHNGEFSPLGSNQECRSDVWVIAATNQDLKKKIAKKKFREDLFYRLNIVDINIPPLRKRKEDIPVLIDYFYESNKQNYPQCQHNKPDSRTLDQLCEYPWPGNVRQLKNIIMHQMVLNSWDKIFDELPQEYPEPSNSSLEEDRIQYFDHYETRSIRTISQFIDLTKRPDKLFENISLKKIKKLAADRVEKEVISFVLEKSDWNRSRAAKILKINYKTLRYKMKEFDVYPPKGDNNPSQNEIGLTF